MENNKKTEAGKKPLVYWATLMYREQHDDTISGAHRPRKQTMFSFRAGNASSTLRSVISGTLAATDCGIFY